MTPLTTLNDEYIKQRSLTEQVWVGSRTGSKNTPYFGRTWY